MFNFNPAITKLFNSIIDLKRLGNSNYILSIKNNDKDMMLEGIKALTEITEYNKFRMDIGDDYFYLTDIKFDSYEITEFEDPDYGKVYVIDLKFSEKFLASNN